MVVIVTTLGACVGKVVNQFEKEIDCVVFMSIFLSHLGSGSLNILKNIQQHQADMFSPQHLASSNGALPPTCANKSIADISGSQAPHPLPATRSLVNNIIMIVIIAMRIVLFKTHSLPGPLWTSSQSSMQDQRWPPTGEVFGGELQISSASVI